VTTSPIAARPGGTYFVPGARLVKLSKTLGAGAEVGEELPILAQDLLRVEVTRVHTGASQFSVTLNNWFDALPADRHDTKNTVTALERLTGEKTPQPLWPRFKHNALEHLEFGDRIRIDLRYWPDPPSAADAATRAAHVWVPMVSGPITDMRFSFGQGAQVTVSGEDDLSQLKDKTQGKAEYKKLSEQSIVRRVLQKAGYPLDRIADPLVPWPAVTKDDARGLTESLQGGQSTLDFLQKLADRLDFEVFVEFDRAEVKPGEGAGLSFHFEPARSLCKPTAHPDGTFVLRREQHLIDFTPTIKVIDQYSEMVVKGRHRDPNQPERVEQMADTAAVAPDMHRDPDLDPPLLSGPAIRAKYFSNRPNRAESPNQTNLDPERAKLLAEALIRKKAREFMTVEATTVGLPRLRPGMHVEVRDYRPPFDGFYYVTKAVYTYGADGFRTKISSRRPGMPEPPYGGR
jgi:hypothetical protein